MPGRCRGVPGDGAAGLPGDTAGAGDEAAPAAAPEGRDDHATTVGGREVMIALVANDTGETLQSDGFEPGGANGDSICEAWIYSGRIHSCAYTPTEGFTARAKQWYTSTGATQNALSVRTMPTGIAEGYRRRVASGG